MSESDWEEFFFGLRRVVNLGDLLWQEKRAAVVKAAERHDASDNLDEFLVWFGGSMEL